jgi:hypothetical protein
MERWQAKMKRCFYYTIPFSCALLLLSVAVPSYSQSKTTITEDDVRALINRSDAASRKGDIAAMMAPLAKDFKMKFAFTNPGSDKEVVQDLNKEQLEFNARHNLRIRRAYKLERKNMKIKIYDDQTAMVTSELYEVFTMKQGTLRGSSSEEIYVGFEDGKLVIKSVDLRTRLY